MKRVLIVDDELVLLRNLTRALSNAGFDVHASSSYAMALQAMAMAPFDLLCVDVNLGDGNGLELVQRARAQHRDVPVIVMTGHDSLHNRTQAENMEVTAFLAKPFALSRIRELAWCLTQSGSPEPSHRNGARGLSVMTYSHDSIGLGHMRRNANIAKGLVRGEVGGSVLMMVGCPAGVGFDLPYGIDFIKLPSVVKIGRNSFESARLRVPKETARDLRANLLLRAAETFRPDIFLVDHEPSGVWGELMPTLRSLSKRSDRPRVVLGLRDILDAPERVCERWRKEGTDRLIRNFYHDVFVYGDQETFDSAALYGLNALLPGRVHYCGYVCDEVPQQPDQRIREQLGFNADPMVLVTGGGGHDAYPMMSRCLDALAHVPPRLRRGSVFVTGPLMDAELRDQVFERARMLGATALASVPAVAPVRLRC